MNLADAFVALGVVAMGHRVIQTLGSDLTAIDYRVRLRAAYRAPWPPRAPRG